MGNPVAEREEQYGTFLVQQIDRHSLPSAFLRDFHHRFDDHRFAFEAVVERSHIHFLRALAQWVLCDQLRLSDETCGDLILVFEEAVSNVLRHSYQDDDSKWLRFVLALENEQLVMTLEDRGERGKNPELSAKYNAISTEGRPPLQHRGGLGLYLLRRIMDAISYTPGGETNRLQMQKTIGGAEGNDGS